MSTFHDVYLLYSNYLKFRYLTVLAAINKNTHFPKSQKKSVYKQLFLHRKQNKKGTSVQWTNKIIHNFFYKLLSYSLNAAQWAHV